MTVRGRGGDLIFKQMNHVENKQPMYKEILQSTGMKTMNKML
jgi:hypothetical protein